MTTNEPGKEPQPATETPLDSFDGAFKQSDARYRTLKGRCGEIRELDDFLANGLSLHAELHSIASELKALKAELEEQLSAKIRPGQLKKRLARVGALSENLLDLARPKGLKRAKAAPEKKKKAKKEAGLS